MSDTLVRITISHNRLNYPNDDVCYTQTTQFDSRTTICKLQLAISYYNQPPEKEIEFTHMYYSNEKKLREFRRTNN
jgi:hypothetical protein